MIAIKTDWKNPDKGMRSIDTEGMTEEEILYEFSLVHHLLVSGLSDRLKVSHDVAQMKLMEVAATTDAAFKDAKETVDSTVAECDVDEDSVGKLLDALGRSSCPVSDEVHAEMEAAIRSLFEDEDFD